MRPKSGTYSVMEVKIIGEQEVWLSTCDRISVENEGDQALREHGGAVFMRCESMAGQNSSLWSILSLSQL